MILSLTISNFLSFKDPVTFSFEATRDKHLEEYHVVEIVPGVRLTKLGIAYGANASGKSNLIHAFDFLRDFLLKSQESKDVQTGAIPFLLNDTSKELPSEFILKFYAQGKKHIYSLKMTQNHVVEESLLYYPGTQPAELFSRTLHQNVSKLWFNPKLKISIALKEEIEAKCLINMSVFAAYNKVNVQVQEIDFVISWIKEKYLFPVLPEVKNLESFTEDLILKDKNVKNYILKFLYEADFNINDIRIDIEEQPVNEQFINWAIDKGLPEDEKERLKKDKTIQILNTHFTHRVMDNSGMESFHNLPESLESEGTIRAMGLSGVMYKLIQQNAFVAIDEIESSFHPRLIEFFIEYFIKQSSSSQLLVTTHYDGLLEEEDLFRNDNIWFTNKKADGSTDLYSLSDFKGVNRISSIQKAYKYGKFSAVPNI
ncbi:MAG: ATP-binding protein [Bacteroidales bacterium]|nr:ATP-binding protein [Bacteroidales bacterium]